MCAQCSVAKSCPALCDLMDCSSPGSSVRGIFQAKILEWVAMCFSRGSSWPRDQNCICWVFCIDRRTLYTVPPGKPWKPQRGLLAPLWSSLTSYSPTLMSVHPGSLAVLHMADLALIPNLCAGCLSAWNVLPSDPHLPSPSPVFP